jgi:hypothetical protein
MGDREAMKATLRFLFELLAEEKDIKFSKEKVEEAIESMHDDDIFLHELIDFLENHLETFGENYGLDWEE